MSWSGQFPTTSAAHLELIGANSSFRYRPKRIAAGELGLELSCRFHSDGDSYGPFDVLDISASGVGVVPSEGIALSPGTILSDFVVEYGGRTIFSGEAASVYQLDTPHARLGLRFSSQVFDLKKFMLADQLIERRLESDLATNADFRTRLSAEFRAAVSDMHHLLQSAKLIIEDVERNQARGDWWRQGPDANELIQQVHSRWVEAYHSQMRRLAELSETLDPADVELARTYCTHSLMPLLYEGPLHRRSYEKRSASRSSRRETPGGRGSFTMPRCTIRWCRRSRLAS